MVNDVNLSKPKIVATRLQELSDTPLLKECPLLDMGTITSDFQRGLNVGEVAKCLTAEQDGGGISEAYARAITGQYMCAILGKWIQQECGNLQDAPFNESILSRYETVGECAHEIFLIARGIIKSIGLVTPNDNDYQKIKDVFDEDIKPGALSALNATVDGFIHRCQSMLDEVNMKAPAPSLALSGLSHFLVWGEKILGYSKQISMLQLKSRANEFLPFCCAEFKEKVSAIQDDNGNWNLDSIYAAAALYDLILREAVSEVSQSHYREVLKEDMSVLRENASVKAKDLYKTLCKETEYELPDELQVRETSDGAEVCLSAFQKLMAIGEISLEQLTGRPWYTQEDFEAEIHTLCRIDFQSLSIECDDEGSPEDTLLNERIAEHIESLKMRISRIRSFGESNASKIEGWEELVAKSQKADFVSTLNRTFGRAADYQGPILDGQNIVPKDPEAFRQYAAQRIEGLSVQPVVLTL